MIFHASFFMRQEFVQKGFKLQHLLILVIRAALFLKGLPIAVPEAGGTSLYHCFFV
jgi:hypothetical protein